MSHEQHQISQLRIRDFLKTTGVKHHMFYGPTSPTYWDEPIRIVALNMEPYGYENEGHMQVDRDTLIDWIYPAKGHPHHTARYSYTIISVLLECIEEKAFPCKDDFQCTFADDTKIERAMERSVYYNLRPESNSQITQDVAAILSVGESELGRLIWEDIKTLDPHLLIVSGKAGLSSLNSLLRLSKPLSFCGHCVQPDGLFIQSMSHPSRPNYSKWSDLAEDIINWFIKKA